LCPAGITAVRGEGSHDTRPREAIEGARAFALDGKRTARHRALAWAAFAAAREVADPVATAAARAAHVAVATPYLHPLATPHQSKHILGSAVYSAWPESCGGQ